jgi:hypothetical protein
MAVSVAPLTTTVMGAVEGNHAGVASGINNAVSRCAGLLAVAVLGILMVGLFGRGLDRRLAASALPPPARTALAAGREKLAALPIPAGLPAPVKAEVQAAVDHAFLDGFRGVMLTAAGLAVLASLSAAWLIEGTDEDKDEDKKGGQDEPGSLKGSAARSVGSASPAGFRGPGRSG